MYFLDQALKQWLTRRKREEDGNTKIWISSEQKEIFRWNKKHLLSCRKELQVALFKNWINVLGFKNYFSTCLPFYLFLMEEILFLYVSTFGYRNRKLHMCILLFSTSGLQNICWKICKAPSRPSLLHTLQLIILFGIKLWKIYIKCLLNIITFWFTEISRKRKFQSSLEILHRIHSALAFL